MKDICVCILAHNEQKHIAETVGAFVENCANYNCDIKVYANGCTDATVEIVRNLAQGIPSLHLRELEMASKPNAWNTAYHENTHSVLIFSDGDVVPETGAVEALWQLLTSEQSEVILAGCSFWPRKSGLTLGQRFVGLLQTPLCQNFLIGGLYGISRKGLDQELKKRNIAGIPLGIVAEDAFLQLLVPTELFSIIHHKVYYEPPSLADYWKYLARIRWQNEQLTAMYGNLFNGSAFTSQGFFIQAVEKIPAGQNIKRLLLGSAAVGLRYLIKAMFRARITKYYMAMGPVNKEGGNILREASRSSSAK